MYRKYRFNLPQGTSSSTCTYAGTSSRIERAPTGTVVSLIRILTEQTGTLREPGPRGGNEKSLGPRTALLENIHQVSEFVPSVSAAEPMQSAEPSLCNVVALLVRRVGTFYVPRRYLLYRDRPGSVPGVTRRLTSSAAIQRIFSRVQPILTVFQTPGLFRPVRDVTLARGLLNVHSRCGQPGQVPRMRSDEPAHCACFSPSLSIYTSIRVPAP